MPKEKQRRTQPISLKMWPVLNKKKLSIEETTQLHKEVQEVLQPIIDKYKNEGYFLVSIYWTVIDAVEKADYSLK